ncbi:unnamed protein product [Discosporangium mesarthrocarpum]
MGPGRGGGDMVPMGGAGGQDDGFWETPTRTVRPGPGPGMGTAGAGGAGEGRRAGGKPAAAFGGSAMSPDMAAWASQQLRKITGKDDLTLLEFCMSLTDASEIRQYLAAYLGSTPQVSSFATEFLQRKQRGRGGPTKVAVTNQARARKACDWTTFCLDDFFISFPAGDNQLPLRYGRFCRPCASAVQYSCALL